MSGTYAWYHYRKPLVCHLVPMGTAGAVCELILTNLFRDLVKIDATGQIMACKLRAEWIF